MGTISLNSTVVDWKNRAVYTELKLSCPKAADKFVENLSVVFKVVNHVSKLIVRVSRAQLTKPKYTVLHSSKPHCISYVTPH